MGGEVINKTKALCEKSSVKVYVSNIVAKETAHHQFVCNLGWYVVSISACGTKGFSYDYV